MPRNRVHAIKDGRYSYSSTDTAGNRHQLTSKKGETLKNFKRRCDALDEHCHFDILQGQMTFDQLFNRWAEHKWPNTEKDLAHGKDNHAADCILTKNMYKAYVKPIIGHRAIMDITRADIYDLLLELRAKKFAASTIRRIKSCISRPYNYAMNTLRMNIPDPITGLRMERKALDASDMEESTIRIYTPDDINLYFKAAQSSKYARYFRLLFLTGMRPSECAGLRLSDIDLINNTIRLQRSITIHGLGALKTKAAYRSIPLTEEIKSLLDEQAQDAENGWFFPSADGVPSLNALQRAHKRILAATAEWQRGARNKRLYIIAPALKRSMYDFRHTFGTLAAENGMPDYVLKKIMGHSSILITKRYYISVTDKALADAKQFMDFTNFNNEQTAKVDKASLA